MVSQHAYRKRPGARLRAYLVGQGRSQELRPFWAIWAACWPAAPTSRRLRVVVVLAFHIRVAVALVKRKLLAYVGVLRFRGMCRHC
jgi:hypothetical protein